MGRLRNLSDNFKAAAFHSRSSSQVDTSGFTKSESARSGEDFAAKETPLVVKTSSSTSVLSPQRSPVALNGGSSSRPASGFYGYQPTSSDREMHIEELVPVFSFLSSHGNKLYQEGYFLKLNDLDTNGKPNFDRNWTECFAQLVGTVLSLWDAAALDAAGSDGEVPPTFINLADASIKMIETLPTRNQDVHPLQNVLSISTAGKNRYLLHFNSLHSLTQWTAGIRLTMFEHSSLQELYTGSLIAGKGKHLNNIRSIMERTKFRHEDWARVRFGAGTPWRRCWCVIEPPDEKEWQRAAKSMKKRSAYERPAYPKGDIRFYDTKKTKKAVPIATITDAYSAYAIYPQSKPLIDQSTLVKVEGKITIHSNPESKTEGFVFVMPEVHPAVSGFEMLLRWLFPVYDTFHLYGRPSRLIADTLDAKGLMFAMPRERRYGYLDIIDVAALIHTTGSEKWSEREWRKQMKEITARRMLSGGQNRSSGTYARTGTSSGLASRNGVTYDDGGSVRSSPSRQGHQSNMSTDAFFETPRKATAPAFGGLTQPAHNYHNRSASENVTLASPSKGRRQENGYVPSRLSLDHRESPEPIEPAPVPPPAPHMNRPQNLSEVELLDSRNSSDSDLRMQRTRSHAEEIHQDMRQTTPPGPVTAPPTFQHQSTDRPAKRPDTRPEMRREKSRMSNATLEQMVDVNRMRSADAAAAGAAAAWGRSVSHNGSQQPRGVNTNAPNANGISANQEHTKAMVADGQFAQSPAEVNPSDIRQSSAHSLRRKPLPPNSSQHSLPPAPPIPPSNPMPAAVMRAQSTGKAPQYAESNYDHDSDESPDYASTRQSEDAASAKSVPRARTGILKTVGGTGEPGEAAPLASKSGIPEIDFGITQSLTPGPSRPSTALGTLGRDSPSTPERKSPGRTPDGLTPEDKRSSYFGRLAHSRSSSHAWQPGTTAGRQSPGPSLTPEEYVQAKYAAAKVPQGYVPQRSISTSTIDQIPTTAPKKLQKKRDSRPSSRNSLLRDYSSNLSAREQEHVAKMTGGPLLHLPDRSRTPDPSVGLIGAIEAREQEKRNIKDGVSGHMVQAAIAQRQHHAQTQQYQAQQHMQAQQAAQQAYHQQHGYGPQQWPAQQQWTSWGAPVQQQQWPSHQYQPHQQRSNQYQQQQWQGQQNQYQQKYGGFY